MNIDLIQSLSIGANGIAIIILAVAVIRRRPE